MNLFPCFWRQLLPRDLKPIKSFADHHFPQKTVRISDHIEKITRPICSIVVGFDFISIGCVKLIKREQVGTFLKAIKEVDKKLSLSKTGKTET